ncbi:Hypothetical protein P9303_22341 [Prochlorococcus marinus str. MIT 9303]|uniref:Uncharacterized protein n=1 Tax=Prochlorococcus marinus (strain MIT 9303) TaxID=59922 RepID=A2CBV9_PROM3|nr:Hypothetical protein P9303_22341 [Prochlorococcus marinus str. MIT 9303]
MFGLLPEQLSLGVLEIVDSNSLIITISLNSLRMLIEAKRVFNVIDLKPLEVPFFWVIELSM